MRAIPFNIPPPLGIPVILRFAARLSPILERPKDGPGLVPAPAIEKEKYQNRETHSITCPADLR